MHQSTKNTTLAKNLFKNKQKTFETRKKKHFAPPHFHVNSTVREEKNLKGKAGANERKLAQCFEEDKPL